MIINAAKSTFATTFLSDNNHKHYLERFNVDFNKIIPN